MEKVYKWILVLSLVLALAMAALQVIVRSNTEIDNLAAMASAGDGNTVVALYDGSRIRFHLLDRGGVIRESFSISRMDGDDIVQIADLAVDESGIVYYLKHYTNRTTGVFTQRQELAAYRWRFRPWGRSKQIKLDGGSSAFRYNWLDITTSLVVTAVDADGVSLERTAYDLESIFTKTPVIKTTRAYPAVAGQGVYKAAVAGSDTVYISLSGKVFLTGESMQAPVQLYPEQTGEYVTSYALFVEAEATGSVIMSERKSGNLYRLYTADGRTEFIGEGSQGLGSLAYTFADLLDISFAPNGESFTATVQNPETYTQELILSLDGSVSLVTGLRRSVPSNIWNFAKYLVLSFLGILIVISILQTIVKAVIASRTILLKLAFTSVPLLIAALVLFGLFTYNSYRSSLSDTYETKVQDQGNLLRALFGSESFDSITSPDRYGGDQYSYIKATMDTRDVYTTSAYFVDRRLYTGVDETLPCLYPYAITGNSDACELYRRVAMTGQQHTGVINDRYGERIACITPAGSSTGDTIFLLETSVFTAEIDKASAPYIRNYLLIAGICILATAALLLVSLTRILGPLREIIAGLEQFSKGDRSVRIPSHTNDELADISRVFNKMAGDIEVQIYTLRNMTDTYYRFIPRRIFQLLGKENLSELQLGSSVQGQYGILSITVAVNETYLDAAGKEEMINHFFTTINETCNMYNATLVIDSIDLQHMLVICPDPSEAVEIAFSAIALIDSHNARSTVQNRMETSFFLHTTDIYFSIFGDSERYVPAMLSADLSRALQDSSRFRRLSSRFIITDATYRLLDTGQFRHRFIGYADEVEERLGLYDLYDSCPPTMIRLFNETLDTFHKAMDLYHQRRYYDAKNLFAVVLRDNQYDNVSRHYIFQCEKKLGKGAVKAHV